MIWIRLFYSIIHGFFHFQCSVMASIFIQIKIIVILSPFIDHYTVSTTTATTIIVSCVRVYMIVCDIICIYIQLEYTYLSFVILWPFYMRINTATHSLHMQRWRFVGYFLFLHLWDAVCDTCVSVWSMKVKEKRRNNNK